LGNKQKENMKRRQINKLFTALAGWTVVASNPLALLVRRSCAALRRRLLPAETDLGTLLFENPKYLDARNLPITPIDKFGLLLTDHLWCISLKVSISSAENLFTAYSDIPLRKLVF
jgi:hypothetical protein